MAAAAIPIPINGAPRQSTPNTDTAAFEQEEALFKALTSRTGAKSPGKLQFSEREAEIAVEHVIREFEDTINGSQQYRQNLVTLAENWRGTTDEKDYPFEGASNVRVPLTSVYIEQEKAREQKALFGGEYWSKLEYVDRQVPKDALNEANQWWGWELREVVKYKDASRDIRHNRLLFGTCVAIPSYHHETRFLHSFKEWNFDDGASLQKLMQDGLTEVLGEKSAWGTPFSYEVKDQPKLGTFTLEAVDKDYRGDGGKIVFSLDLNKQPARLRADIWKREVMFDGVRVNVVNFEDLVVPNTDADINKIPFFGVRLWFSLREYLQGIRDGFFIDYGPEETLKIIGAGDDKTGEYLDQPLTRLQDLEEGTDSTDTSSNAPTHKFIECYRWEGWWSWSKKHDDPNDFESMIQPAVQVCMWVNPRTKKLLKVERLEDLNKDGKRSGVKFGFIREPGRFYEIGMAEWGRHCQTLHDAINNQRVDSNLLFNVPWGFYKPTAGLKGAIRIEPGVFHPSADPNAVNMPRTNWNPVWSLQEEMFQRQLADMQMGFSPASAGQAHSKRQTATEIAQLAAALDLRTEDVVDQLRAADTELQTKIIGLYQQYGPPERMFRVGGEDGLKQTKMFERDRLAGRIQIVNTGSLMQINEQMQRQIALEMFTMLLNPFLIQGRIVGPDTIYAAVKLIAKLHHYDEVPLHQPATPPMSDAPEVEERQMIAGQKPTGPTMGENTDEHLQHHLMTMADKDIAWEPQAMMLFQQHIQATMQMKDAQMLQQQQQVALAGQMAKTMGTMGINPGQPGGQDPGTNEGPGTAAEGAGGVQSPQVAQPAPGQGA